MMTQILEPIHLSISSKGKRVEGFVEVEVAILSGSKEREEIKELRHFAKTPKVSRLMLGTMMRASNETRE